MVHCIVKSAIGALVCSLCLDTISWFSGIITVPYSSSSTDLDSQYLPTVYSVFSSHVSLRRCVGMLYGWSLCFFSGVLTEISCAVRLVSLRLLSIRLQLPVDPQTYIWQEAVHQCKYKRNLPFVLEMQKRHGSLSMHPSRFSEVTAAVRLRCHETLHHLHHTEIRWNMARGEGMWVQESPDGVYY